MGELNIERFIQAQDRGRSYDEALQEIRGGRKQSHWIWYVFPQMRGLGHSGMSEAYGIASLKEAEAYLEEPTLRARLYEISRALLGHSGKSAREILGGTDAMKVRSCMTLFDVVSPNDVFNDVLTAFYKGKRCRRTLEMIGELREKG